MHYRLHCGRCQSEGSATGGRLEEEPQEGAVGLPFASAQSSVGLCLGRVKGELMGGEENDFLAGFPGPIQRAGPWESAALDFLR